MRNIFPFGEIKKGANIVLYGAAERGYDFYRQILSTDYCNIVLWVDRQYEWYRYMNLPIDQPEKIKESEFDLVLVAAEKETVYFSIKKDLLDMGVDSKKIFWKENCSIVGNCIYKYDRERIRREAEDSYILSPKKLINERSLDITIRYMYARDIIEGKSGSENEHRYIKFMEAANGFNEPTENIISAFFSEYYIKQGKEIYIKAFKELIESIKDVGFKREYFIPIDKNGHMINGGHRIAAALALEKDVWVRKYPFDGLRIRFGSKWFLEHGFSKEEVDYIERINEGLMR